MQQLLHNANYQPAMNAGIAALGLAACAVVVISLLHTLHLLGGRTLLYRKHPPVAGWGRRFYPASGVMVIFLLMLMWLLNAWSHSHGTTH